VVLDGLQDGVLWSGVKMEMNWSASKLFVPSRNGKNSPTQTMPSR
jgi:hypothetical protein